MPIDVEVALAAELEPLEFSWSSSDIQLYHLGLGAGKDPMDRRELRYLVDDTPQVLKLLAANALVFSSLQRMAGDPKNRRDLLQQAAALAFQTALSLALLSAAGLLTMTLHRLENQDFGFAQDRRLVGRSPDHGPGRGRRPTAWLVCLGPAPSPCCARPGADRTRSSRDP